MIVNKVMGIPIELYYENPLLPLYNSILSIKTMKCEDDYSELIGCYLFNLLFKKFLFILARASLRTK